MFTAPRPKLCSGVLYIYDLPHLIQTKLGTGKQHFSSTQFKIHIVFDTTINWNSLEMVTLKRWSQLR